MSCKKCEKNVPVKKRLTVNHEVYSSRYHHPIYFGIWGGPIFLEYQLYLRVHMQQHREYINSLKVLVVLAAFIRFVIVKNHLRHTVVHPRESVYIGQPSPRTELEMHGYVVELVLRGLYGVR